jgi:hypothetical protein
VTAAPGCRFGDRCSLDTYEQAVECLGSHSEMTRTEIAARVGQLHPSKTAGYLRACLAPFDGTHTIQMPIAPAFTLASGNPALLAWHARAAGYGIHRLPTAASSRDELLVSLTDVFGAVGELANAVKTAHSDRRVTPAERLAVTQRGQQAIAELVELIAAVNLDADPSEARR